MTLVQFFVNFLRPYKDMPEFTSCVMKALKELGRAIARESFYEESGSIKSCHISGKEANVIIVDELCDE